MFRLKVASACAFLSTACLLVLTAVALSGGPSGAIVGFGLGGAAVGFVGWRAGKLVE